MFDTVESTRRFWIIVSSLAGLTLIAVLVFAVPLLDVKTTTTQMVPVTEQYYGTETVTHVEDGSYNIAADVVFELTAGNMVYSVDMDLSNKTDSIVTGYFILRDKSLDYTFYVVGEDEYDQHSVYSQVPPVNPYVAIVPGDHDTNNSFSFVPDVSGEYYLVFNTLDESPDFYKTGQIVFGAFWEYWETVEETVQVPMERTVMEEETVISTERLTIWEYLFRG